MITLNFDARFAQAVAEGSKTTTIRRGPKDNCPPCRVGDILTFYTSLQTQSPKKLGEGICVFLGEILIAEDEIRGGGVPFSAKSERYLARLEGFAAPGDLRGWFADKYGLPFRGWLIGWHTPPEVPEWLLFCRARGGGYLGA